MIDSYILQVSNTSLYILCLKSQSSEVQNYKTT